MRSAHLLVPVLVLLALWFVTRGEHGACDRLEGPRAMSSIEVASPVASRGTLEVGGRGERAEPRRLAVSDDEAHASKDGSSAHGVVRIEAGKTTSHDLEVSPPR